MNDLHHLELWISKFLRYSTIIVSLILLAGFLLNTSITSTSLFGYQTYDPISLKEIIFFYIKQERWGQLISYSGLFLLILLPLIRVTLTAILFLKQKDWKMALISFFVLIGLLLSFTLGIDF